MSAKAIPTAWSPGWSALTGMLMAVIVSLLSNGAGSSLDAFALQSVVGAALFAGAAVAHNSMAART